MLPEAPPNRGASIFQSSVSKIESLWPYRTAIERSLSDRSSAAITADDSMETGDTNKEVHMEDRRQQREFRAIDETEISDFNVVLREQGFDRDDFELAEELDEPRRAAIEGLITSRYANGKQSIGRPTSKRSVRHSGRCARLTQRNIAPPATSTASITLRKSRPKSAPIIWQIQHRPNNGRGNG